MLSEQIKELNKLKENTCNSYYKLIDSELMRYFNWKYNWPINKDVIAVNLKLIDLNIKIFYHGSCIVVVDGISPVLTISSKEKIRHYEEV